MRALCVVAIACIALITTEGCRRPKREPVPGPQSGILGINSVTFGITSHKKAARSQHGMRQGIDGDTPGMEHGAVGIAWFQGAVDEAFSKAGARRNAGSHPSVPMCPGSMPTSEHSRQGSGDDDA